MDFNIGFHLRSICFALDYIHCQSMANKYDKGWSFMKKLQNHLITLVCRSIIVSFLLIQIKIFVFNALLSRKAIVHTYLRMYNADSWVKYFNGRNVLILRKFLLNMSNFNKTKHKLCLRSCIPYNWSSSCGIFLKNKTSSYF
jgi:hypothetical protein